jgi:hypothetical protein
MTRIQARLHLLCFLFIRRENVSCVQELLRTLMGKQTEVDSRGKKWDPVWAEILRDDEQRR